MRRSVRTLQGAGASTSASPRPQVVQAPNKISDRQPTSKNGSVGNVVIMKNRSETFVDAAVGAGRPPKFISPHISPSSLLESASDSTLSGDSVARDDKSDAESTSSSTQMIADQPSAIGNSMVNPNGKAASTHLSADQSAAVTACLS